MTTDFLADTPVISRIYCPGCEPTTDPTREIVESRYCHFHSPPSGGLDDEAVTTAFLSGVAEAEGHTCRLWADWLRSVRRAAASVVAGAMLGSAVTTWAQAPSAEASGSGVRGDGGRVSCETQLAVATTWAGVIKQQRDQYDVLIATQQVALDKLRAEIEAMKKAAAAREPKGDQP